MAQGSTLKDPHKSWSASYLEEVQPKLQFLCKQQALSIIWLNFFNFLTPMIWLLILPITSFPFPRKFSSENFVLDQVNNFYLISLNIFITCLLDNVRILWEEVSSWSLLGV